MQAVQVVSVTSHLHKQTESNINLSIPVTSSHSGSLQLRPDLPKAVVLSRSRLHTVLKHVFCWFVMESTIPAWWSDLQRLQVYLNEVLGYNDIEDPNTSRRLSILSQSRSDTTNADGQNSTSMLNLSFIIAIAWYDLSIIIASYLYW